MKKRNFFEAWSDRFLGLILAGTLLLCLFGEGTTYGLKLPEKWPDLFCLPMGCLVLAVLCFALRKLIRSPKKRTGIMALLTLAAWFLSYWFMSQTAVLHPWDSDSLYRGAKELVTEGQSGLLDFYLSQDPNNLVLAWWDTLLWRLALLLGLQEAYGLMLLCQTGAVALSLWLIWRCADELWGKEQPWLPLTVWSMGFLLLAFNPMVTENYSDVPALLLVTLAARLALSLRNGRQLPGKLFALGLLTYGGYRIKPMVAFVLIAAVPVLFLPTLWQKRKQWLGFLLPAMALICGLVLAFGLVTAAVSGMNVHLDHEKALSAAHYLMMGMNSQGQGIFYFPDLHLSVAHQTYAERFSANLAILQERLSTAGPKGILDLFLRKQLTNFNDGTFAWYSNTHTEENIQWFNDLPLFNGQAAEAIRKFTVGEGFLTLQGLMQCLWLGVLFLAALGCLRKTSDGLSVVRLTLLGLILFELLFEASPRYIYAFVPLFVLTAGSGARKLAALQDRTKATFQR